MLSENFRCWPGRTWATGSCRFSTAC
jgi:hypothetical protein